MANTLTGIIGQYWQPFTQQFLNNSLVVRDISNVMHPTEKEGNTINWPYTPTQRVQIYTASTDMTIDPVVAANSTMTLAQQVASAFNVDRIQQSQATVEWVARQAAQSAYELGNRIDQYTFNKGATLAAARNANSVGGAITPANINSVFAASYARLDEANAGTARFVVIDPSTMVSLTSTFIANGFKMADDALENGFVGKDSIGFRVYKSNNLPFSGSLGLATNPTANDTITIKGVTFKFVANGTAANPGEISIGANIAATQPIVVNAINGTGTPGASTYIELATTDRRTLQSAQVLAGAFSSNKTALTGFGRLSATSSLTATSDGFGTTTKTLIAGAMGAMSLGIQKEIFTEIKEEPKQFSTNYLTGTLFDATVFYRDTFRLSAITANE